MPPTDLPDSRTRILDAVARLLVREGGDGVTIAAVAREAGVSKGGLFYHFPSKEALVEGAVAAYVAGFDELVGAAGDEPGAATLAYLDSARDADGPADRPVLALLAAALATPVSLAALRERYARWQHRLEHDGVPTTLAITVRLVVDGLWLADTFDLAPITGAARSAVLDDLRGQVAAALATAPLA